MTATIGEVLNTPVRLWISTNYSNQATDGHAGIQANIRTNDAASMTANYNSDINNWYLLGSDLFVNAIDIVQSNGGASWGIPVLNDANYPTATDDFYRSVTNTDANIFSGSYDRGPWYGIDGSANTFVWTGTANNGNVVGDGLGSFALDQVNYGTATGTTPATVFAGNFEPAAESNPYYILSEPFIFIGGLSSEITDPSSALSGTVEAHCMGNFTINSSIDFSAVNNVALNGYSVTYNSGVLEASPTIASDLGLPNPSVRIKNSGDTNVVEGVVTGIALKAP
jgi:hypothetical protein